MTSFAAMVVSALITKKSVISPNLSARGGGEKSFLIGTLGAF